VPLGALTALAGRQGLGKSTLTIKLASLASRGLLAGHLIEEPSMCLFVTEEDALRTTVVPRLRACKADMSKIAFLSVGEEGLLKRLTIPDDVGALAERAREVRAKFLVIDPIVSFLREGLSENSDQEVRQALSPLAKMAENLDASVLYVRHVSKAEYSSILDRVGGSVAWTAAARSVLLFGDDPDDYSGKQRVVAHAKCNIGPLLPSLSCALETVRLNGSGPQVSTSQIVFGGNVDVKAADLLDSDQTRSEYREATDFLLQELAQGAVETRKLLKGARSLGISDRTLYRAKADLRIRSERDPFGTGWSWRLR